MISPTIIAGIALFVFTVQFFEYAMKWRDKSLKSYEKFTKVAMLGASFLVFAFGTVNAIESYERYLPRRLTNPAAYISTLSRYGGLIVQVIGSGVSDSQEACQLKSQLDNVFTRSRWQLYFGPCERPPWEEADRPQTGVSLFIEHDSRATKAANALQAMLWKERWFLDGTPAMSWHQHPSSTAIITTMSTMATLYGDPERLSPSAYNALIRKLRSLPTNKDPISGMIMSPVYPVDLVIEVYDKRATSQQPLPQPLTPFYVRSE